MDHIHAHHGFQSSGEISRGRLTASATAHCLMGCGLGEIVGVVIGTALAFSNTQTIILAVTLGFAFGFALGLIPLLRAGLSWRHSLKQVLVAEGLSIVVMETAEVLVEVYTPGVMNAGLLSPLFWSGMLRALSAGYSAAYPVNYWMIGKGLKHCH